MPRIRTIKPEFFSSPAVADLSMEARLVFIGLWCWADDTGTGTYNPRELVGFVFPNDNEITESEFVGCCAEISRTLPTVFYRVGRRCFYKILSWAEHQSKAANGAAGKRGSKYPQPDRGEPINPETLQVIGGSEHNSAKVPKNPEENRGVDSFRELSANFGIGTGEQGNRGTGEVPSRYGP